VASDALRLLLHMITEQIQSPELRFRDFDFDSGLREE
jgi:hypothetical protein